MTLVMTLYMTLQQAIGQDSVIELGFSFFRIRIRLVVLIYFRILLEIKKSLTASIRSLPHTDHAYLKNWLAKPSDPGLFFPGMLYKALLISSSMTWSSNCLVTISQCWPHCNDHLFYCPCSHGFIL